MVLERCQGSSVNIQMLPRITDSRSGQGDVVKMEKRSCQEKRLFHPIQYLAFLITGRNVCKSKDLMLKFLLLCCSSVFIFMSTITFKLKSSGEYNDNPTTMNKI